MHPEYQKLVRAAKSMTWRSDNRFSTEKATHAAEKVKADKYESYKRMAAGFQEPKAKLTEAGVPDLSAPAGDAGDPSIVDMPPAAPDAPAAPTGAPLPPRAVWLTFLEKLSEAISKRIKDTPSASEEVQKLNVLLSSVKDAAVVANGPTDTSLDTSIRALYAAAMEVDNDGDLVGKFKSEIRNQLIKYVS